jgi:enterobactin synthetase component D
MELIHMDFEYLTLANHPGGLPDVVVLTFNPIEGSAALFEQFGISCPTSVARAVLKRRSEYLAGRRVALQALRQAGADVSDVGVGAMRAPHWPGGYVGSITHSGNVAAAVAMSANRVRGIGLDLERVVSGDAISAIRQLVLSPVEEEAIHPLALRFGQLTAMTIAFSAKESFYKATASTVGRIFDFTVVRVTSACADLGVIEMRVVEALTPDLALGRVFVMGFSVLRGGAVITSCVWLSSRSGRYFPHQK